VLIIDDVTTTGSTLDACADALLNAGAKSVYGLTIARAILKE
jgi:predicted amidophosphoribosyltransferase